MHRFHIAKKQNKGTLKIMKKVLSILLTLIMAFSTMPLLASAGNFMEEDLQQQMATLSLPNYLLTTSTNEIRPFSEATMLFGIDGESKSEPITVYSQNESTTKRYTVLVLDTTGTYSISTGWFSSVIVGSPLSKVKEAANIFITSVLQAEGENYVSIVAFGDEAQIISGFSSNKDALTSAVSVLPETDSNSSSGLSNSNGGFVLANQLIDQVTDSSAIKNVVFFTGCVPGAGNYSETGRYQNSSYDYYVTKTGIPVKHYANSLYDTYEILKNKCYVYTLVA